MNTSGPEGCFLCTVCSKTQDDLYKHFTETMAWEIQFKLLWTTLWWISATGGTEQKSSSRSRSERKPPHHHSGPVATLALSAQEGLLCQSGAVILKGIPYNFCCFVIQELAIPWPERWKKTDVVEIMIFPGGDRECEVISVQHNKQNINVCSILARNSQG